LIIFATNRRNYERVFEKLKEEDEAVCQYISPVLEAPELKMHDPGTALNTALKLERLGIVAVLMRRSGVNIETLWLQTSASALMR
jgi:hypothetical protein